MIHLDVTSWIDRPRMMMMISYICAHLLHLCNCSCSPGRSGCHTDSQDVADDSDAPHVRLQAHRLIADHLWGHKLRGAMHHHQRFTRLWQTQQRHKDLSVHTTLYGMWLDFFHNTIINVYYLSAHQNVVFLPFEQFSFIEKYGYSEGRVQAWANYGLRAIWGPLSSLIQPTKLKEIMLMQVRK